MKLILAFYLALNYIAPLSLATYEPHMIDPELGQPESTHSLVAPFLQSEYDSAWWDFGGNTLVRVYDYIRLTSDIPQQNGWIWSKAPLNAAAWTVVLDFHIHGKNPKFFADGFAFWFTDSPFKQGPVFGSADNFKGLGIFFDTFANGKHDHSFPYISAMIGDGKKGYDHSQDNKGSLAGHGCEANIRGTAEAVTAKITYFKNNVLQLSFRDKKSEEWQTCFTISPVTLPNAGYIGMSSRTGELSDNHDILKMETFVHLLHDSYTGKDATTSDSSPDYQQQANSDSQTGGIPKSSSDGGSFFGFLFRMVGLGGVVAVGVMAYRTYSKKSMKRF